MTIDVDELRARLRRFADEAAGQAREQREKGDQQEASFQSGRQAGFVTALAHLTLAEQDAARERDANMVDEALGEEAARLGLIGRGAAVDLGAVERLEEFARTAGGAVDMASGTVHSDAGGGSVMRGYALAIAEITGVTDDEDLRQIEELMRLQAGGVLDRLTQDEFRDLAEVAHQAFLVLNLRAVRRFLDDVGMRS